MAWAQEMKNLVADIKIGHKDRTQYVKDVKGETARLMEGHRAWIKDNKKNVADLLGQYVKEMKEMARDLKDFLAKSEEKRVADFKAMIKEVKGVVAQIKKITKGLLADYRAERKEAAEYWASLSLRGKKVVPTSEEKKEENKP